MTQGWPDARAWIQILRKYGLNVTVAEGWNDPKHEVSAGYGGVDTPAVAFVMHDTGTGVPASKLRNDHSLNWILYGVKNKAGQPVRACHLYIARNGDLTCVYARRTWHAGIGKAYPEWGVPASMLNRYSIGMEIESQGGGVQDLTPAQIKASALAAAATLDLLGLDESHLINHKDYAGAAQGKVDTAYSADFWRRKVREAWAAHRNTPPKAAPYPGKPVRKGDKSAQVTTIQLALGISADGVFGPATERALARWKKSHLVGRDGSVLRRTGYNRLVRFGRRRSRLS